MIHWTHPLAQLAVIIEMECCIFAYYKARQRHTAEKRERERKIHATILLQFFQELPMSFVIFMAIFLHFSAHVLCTLALCTFQLKSFKSTKILQKPPSGLGSWPVNALAMFTFWTYFTHNFQWSSYHFTSLSHDCVIDALIERIRAI